MLETNDPVVEEVVHQIILTRADGEPLTLQVRSHTYAQLLEAWRVLENERGVRLSLEQFLALASKRVLDQRDPQKP